MALAWEEITRLFEASFRSSLHFSIATVTSDGLPHVTPIGSLILTQENKGVYFEQFTTQMPKNFIHQNRVCVLAVNSSRWFWFKSLLRGRFSTPPALRLTGTVGARRKATDHELKLWHRRISFLKNLKGYNLLWKDMLMVREITFDACLPVRLGAMTTESQS